MIVAGGNAHVATPPWVKVNFTGTTPRLTLNTLEPSALIGCCTCATYAGVAVGVGVAVAVAVGVAVAVAVAVAVGVAVAVAVAVAVGVDVGEGEGVGGWTSNAPMSMLLFTTRSKPGPRWS